MGSKGPYYGEGDWPFAVTEQGFSFTEKNETPYFFLRGKPQGAEKKYEREIAMFLTDASIDYTIEKLRSIGWEGDSFKDLDPSNPDGTSWVGGSITARCEHETSSKGVFERWEIPLSGSGKKSDKPPKPKSDPTAASKLDAMFSGKLKGGGGAPKKQETPPAAGRQPPSNRRAGNPDDIPF